MKSFCLFTLVFCLVFRTEGQTAESYGFAASQETYNSIKTFGIAATANGDDLFDTSIPIGFTFNYCGTNYSQLYASSNGFISLPNILPSSGAPSASNNLNSVQLLNFGTGLICPFWDDLDGTGRETYYTTLGTQPNRVFVFEWVNFGLYGGLSGATEDTLNFQVKLYETTGTIQFCYGEHDFPTLAATIAIINSNTDYQTLNNSGSNPTPSATDFTTNISSLPADGQVYTWFLGPAYVAENQVITSVYPNPTKGNLNLVCRENMKRICCYDVTGKLIHEEFPNVSNVTLYFDIPGVYELLVFSESGCETHKFMVE